MPPTVGHIVHRGLCPRKTCCPPPTTKLQGPSIDTGCWTTPGGGKGLAWFTGVAWGCGTCSCLGTVAAVCGFCALSVLCYHPVPHRTVTHRIVPRRGRTESRLLFPFESKSRGGWDSVLRFETCTRRASLFRRALRDVDGCRRLLVL